ncbi:hypothetical protein AYO40_05575 [Planctomycetaceae bacterium SCGC AG-212-D15]|nr:hypothetical protein AYO40_05575 [Planctomycetaceae bacterium SCGC AG-212-D15]
MDVITISRAYGAGGGEVAKKLAAALGWELLDRELLHQAAAIEHVPDADLERLDEHEIGFFDRFRFHPPHERYLHGLTEAARRAAARGKVVLVGRGVRHLLGDADALHVRLVATPAWRAERMARREGWSGTEAEARVAAVDRTRDRFMRYFFGPAATDPASFDLVINTERVPPDDVVAGIVQMITPKPRGESSSAADQSRRVVTLSRELGAWGTDFIPQLARLLELKVCDRELLADESRRLGVPVEALQALDERPIGLIDWALPSSLHQRYVEAMAPLIKERAAAGGVLLVGRGGNRILADDPAAFRLRLVATRDFRIRRVMSWHWMREGPAARLIDTTDERRAAFAQNAFGGNWNDALEYDLTLNTGRLGPPSIDVAAFFALRYWARVGGAP